MTKEDWVAAALTDDSVVAELLFRMKQQSSSSSSSLPQSFSHPPSNSPLPPQRWGHRKPRSRPGTSTRKDSMTTRCSPTTPLSWSGGAASPSDGGYDESSNPHSDLSSAVRSKGNFTAEITNSSGSNKRTKRKKTFAELKEEESLLLRERTHLKRELASLHVTLKEQRVRSENLRRIKFDLNLQSTGEIGLICVEQEVVVSNHQMELPANDPSHSVLPRNNFVPSDSHVIQKADEVQKRGFVLPDLNMMPSDEEICSETCDSVQ